MEMNYRNSITKCGQGYANPFEGLLEDLKPVGSFKDSKYDVVSAMCFLIGVYEETIQNYPQHGAYGRLKLDKNARIIRNLCMLRTSIIRNYKQINVAMTREFRLFENLAGEFYIPADAMRQLKEDGVKLKYKVSKPSEIILQINRVLMDKLNNCKYLLPDYVRWEYIRDLLIMPNGLCEAGTKAAAEQYYANKGQYSYQCYYNWTPMEVGNIFLDDKKFLEFLYEQHNDYFVEFTKTSDVGSLVKGRIYDFLDQSHKVVAFVDCENSDPYKLCAALGSLSPEALAKLSKIIIFDDVHTTIAWSVLENFVQVPVEYMLVQRIHAGKSLVDSRLIARICKEHYTEGVDGILMVSSDSDYFSIIEDLNGSARFMLMLEKNKTSPVLKEGLLRKGISFCWLDEFYSGGADEIRERVCTGEISRTLEDYTFDLEELLEEALYRTRATMTGEEKVRFLERLLQRLVICVDDHQVHVEIKK